MLGYRLTMTRFESLITHCPSWLIPPLMWVRSWVYPPSPHLDSEFIDASVWAEGYTPRGDMAVYEQISKFSEN